MVSLLEGRKVLDDTLSCKDFISREGLQEFLKTHLESEGLVERDSLESRTDEVWEFIEDMRSVSVENTKHLKRQDSADSSSAGHDRNWRLKVDNGEYRVLYRKGPEGTPFHALCLEGVVEGPAVTALCVAWEAPHFQEWWPQFSVPPFRIVESKYLKRIQTGIDIAYVRFKVPWPFAQREICIISFEVEHEERGAVLALMKSVPENPKLITGKDGYDASETPPPKGGAVRMGVTGGYILQQLGPNQCYFRTISNIDMKLDMVPAWMINFISRQLSGNGFKLFQEAVTEACENKKGHGAVFQKLQASGPLYLRVQKSLDYSLKLQEAKKAGAKKKLKEAEEDAGLAFRKTIGEKMDENLANSLSESGDSSSREEETESEANYEDLKSRDPEVFEAVRSIDKAIAFLKGKKSRSVIGRSRSSSLKRVEEESSSSANGVKDIIATNGEILEVGDVGIESKSEGSKSQAQVLLSKDASGRIDSKDVEANVSNSVRSVSTQKKLSMRNWLRKKIKG